MGRKYYKIPIDEALYNNFREHVKRTQGRVRNNLTLSVEEALKLYMELGIKPGSHEGGISDLTLGGGGGTPSSHEVKDRLFMIEFKTRFEGYQLIGSGELMTFIQSETGARNKSTIKKWRNKLRDNGLIVYVGSNKWRLTGSDTDKQTSLSRYNNVYSYMEPGKTISFKKIMELCNGTEDKTKEIIDTLESEGRLQHLGPGSWKVLSPENVAGPGAHEITDNPMD
jgi:hypothetical protein